MCGEHDFDYVAVTGVTGSSPRVRGALSKPPSGPADAGIIPACAGTCAGSTCRPGSRPRRRWDHPRVCGEHNDDVYKSVQLKGSSPRVRGARVVRRGRIVGRGIIPACAGSTELRSIRGGCRRDYPRVCGEHAGCIACSGTATGSSPRVRGAPRMKRF